MNSPISTLRCQHHRPQHLTIANLLFDEHYLLEMAIATGFYKRDPRKIDICSLLSAICAESVKVSPSCNDLASSIETSHPGCGPSRQAVHLRMGDSFHTFIHRILEDLIGGGGPGVRPCSVTPDDSVQKFARSAPRASQGLV